MRILFAVHRYAPYPGGSEYYVQDMAEECHRRGHDVYVIAEKHQGDLNGIKVFSDFNRAISTKWDLCVIHGSDCSTQTQFHVNANRLQFPCVYMIIKPSESSPSLFAMKHHKYLAYSTTTDHAFLAKHDLLKKARRIRHGINADNSIISQIQKTGNRPRFVSAGGFWEHKKMVPLAVHFTRSGIEGDMHLYGYAGGAIPKEQPNIKIFFDRSKPDILRAIAESDAYILNSSEEGFGLVLLEAMINRVPWAARNIAAAKDMPTRGLVYENEKDLMEMLKNREYEKINLESNYEYVMKNHTIQQTVNDIEDIFLEEYA